MYLKNNWTLLVIGFFSILISCKNEDESDTTEETPITGEYRNDMRNFVIGISEFAKSTNPNFSVIPQNGIELVTTNGEWDGPKAQEYLNAIDGHGQEDLFFGYYDDDQATPFADFDYLQDFLDVSLNNGNTILVTDYCSSESNMDQSYETNENANYISFAAPVRELNVIPNYPPSPYNENSSDIETLDDARNFLYLINPSEFLSKEAFIEAISETNYDAIIMDLFFSDGSEFTNSEIEQLKSKANGSSRLVICYMSIGEAEDYRYYWETDWLNNPPSWLDGENPDWEGNYKVKYWDPQWQSIIYGNANSYLQKIINAGFNGVYLDIIDAFEYYESL